MRVHFFTVQAHFFHSSSFENPRTDNISITNSPVTFKADRFTSSSPYKEDVHVQYGGKYLLSNDITFKESGIRENDSELHYDTDLELTCSSASDITYVYENSSFCDSSVRNSSEKVSVSGDNTFVYNISSNELSTENSNLCSENTFDTDCLETSSPSRDVTAGSDF